MFYYVYLDPQVIVESHGEGTSSVEALTSILYNLSQNCFLADFDTFQVQNDIRSNLIQITGEFDIAMLKKAIAHFEKNDLFVNCLIYDYSAESSLSAMALSQRELSHVEYFLLDQVEYEASEGHEYTGTVATYYSSSFDEQRRRTASYGIELAADRYDELSFMNNYFYNPLKFARRIDIVDRQCGENYKDNYDYNVDRFLKWLSRTNSENPAITFHLGFPGVKESTVVTDDDLRGLDRGEIEPTKIKKLLDAIKRHQPRADLRISCYDDKFSHQRYIVTNQVAFSIDMGMDFLDHRKGKNRKVSMSLKDAREILSQLPAPAEVLPKSKRIN